MKVAVIGGGVYGCTIAIALARAGHETHLFEKNSALLQEASQINQYRLHKGYHYPRSDETTQESVANEPLFIAEYPGTILEQGKHYYAIAKNDSKTSREEYLVFCERNGLPFEIKTPSILNPDAVDLSIQVPEVSFSPTGLVSSIKDKLAGDGVYVHLNTRGSIDTRSEFDQVIVAGYASMNHILDDIGFCGQRKEYQFEVCEKPVFKTPEVFHDMSVVIMDGPFMCVDPYDTTGLSVMGHVVHAIHHDSVGLYPEVPESFENVLNRGVVKDPKKTNADKFIKTGATYFPQVKEFEHVGSMYTIRTVLPNKDKTDERPTIVDRIDEDIITVFSGKIGGCVAAAREIVDLLKKKR